MRKLFIMLAVILFITGCGSDRGVQGPVNVLAIRDISSDPFAFTGVLTINGVVTDFLESDTAIFRLKDTQEILLCLQLHCDSFRLPVKYIGSGGLPKIADEVNITGRWSDTGDGVIFEATAFAVRRNIMQLIERGAG
jgi:hypothetical protein